MMLSSRTLCLLHRIGLTNLSAAEVRDYRALADAVARLQAQQRIKRHESETAGCVEDGVRMPELPVKKPQPVVASTPDYARFWRLFSFVLSPETRERVFEPAYHDLLEDFVLARREPRNWARRWIHFAFMLRSIVMVLDCVRASVFSRRLRPNSRLLRKSVKRTNLPHQQGSSKAPIELPHTKRGIPASGDAQL